MTIHMHADDYGLSKGITDAILDTVDNGVLSGVSVMANGHALAYAITEYQKRSPLRLSIHLNVTEGKPVLPPTEVALLVNERGFFRHSFTTLWFSYVCAAPKKRQQFRREVHAELSAQIRKVQHALGAEHAVRVDSHQYIHMIPFVFHCLLDIHGRQSLSYLRLPKEPFFLSLSASGALRSYCGANVLKHMLLNTLSRIHEGKLHARSIPHNNYFIGVLFTGRMSEASVARALRRIKPRAAEGEVVEVLFHPGAAEESERALWDEEMKAHRHFYYAPERRSERRALKSRPLRDLITTP